MTKQDRLSIAATNLVNVLDFEQLLDYAYKFEVYHEAHEWIDEERDDRIRELREDLIEAMIERDRNENGSNNS